MASPGDPGSADDAGNTDDAGDTTPPERQDAQRRRAAQVAAARERFIALSRRRSREIDLAEAALLVAAEEFPHVDVPRYLGMLDRLAERVRTRLHAAATLRSAGAHPDPDAAALAALHGVLFDEEGFTGASGVWEHEDYFLSGGLDHKRGLPIVLSVIYCEVARRAGLHAVGIALPQRFMAQFRGEHASVLVDPFDGGRRLPPDERPMGIAQDRLPVASNKQILARMLQNMKLLYVQSRPPQLMKGLAAVERILALTPTADQIRDRGLLLRGLGTETLERAKTLRRSERNAAAWAIQRASHLHTLAWLDLKLYARAAEGASEAGQIGEIADQLWRQLGRNN